MQHRMGQKTPSPSNQSHSGPSLPPVPQPPAPTHLLFWTRCAHVRTRGRGSDAEKEQKERKTPNTCGVRTIGQKIAFLTNTAITDAHTLYAMCQSFSCHCTHANKQTHNHYKNTKSQPQTATQKRTIESRSLASPRSASFGLFLVASFDFQISNSCHAKPEVSYYVLCSRLPVDVHAHASSPIFHLPS